MPTVPQYSRQVGTAPLPTVRVPVNAPEGTFSNPLAEALPTAVRVSAQRDEMQRQIEQKAKVDADEMVVDQAERQMLDARQSILEDPNTGAINKRGLNALTALPEAQQAWQKRSGEIASSLTNEEQRQAFARRERGHYAQMVEQITAHTSAEVRKSDIETTNSFLNNGLADVHADPAKAEAVVSDALKRIVAFGTRQGWSPETIKEKAAAHVSDIHATAISSLVQRGTPESADAAQQYLEAHRKELVGQQLDDAEHLVDAGLAEGAGLREADRILGMSGDSGTLPSQGQQEGAVAPGKPKPGKAPISRVEALAQAEAIADPRTRKAATEALMSHFNNVDRLQHLDRQEAMTQVLQQVEASGGRLNRASPAFQKLIGHPEEAQVLHRQDQLLRPAKDPGDPEAFTTHLNLGALAAGNPELRDEFLKLDFTGKDGAGMNQSQKTRLILMQKTYRTGVAHETKAAADYAKKHPFASIIAEAKGGAAGTVQPQQGNAPTGNVDLGAAPHAATPTHSAANPLGDVLTPLKKPTQSMLDDIARKGPRYAAYLRTLGYDAPDHVPAPAHP